MILSFLLIPLMAVDENKISIFNQDNRTSQPEDKSIHKTELERLNKINLYITEEKKTIALEVKEYIVGVVAAEMSAENNVEALKAQALAAFTYAYRKHQQKGENNNEYDLTNDSKIDQRYLNSDDRKMKWGDNFEEYEKKVETAVEEVKNKLIVYNNEPILSAYHSISSGKTETAKNVWGTDYPYLQSENSVGDLLCPEFYSEVVISPDDFATKLSILGVTPETEYNKFIGETQKSESGTVLSIKLCNRNFSGAEIREAFDLKSAAFDLVLKDGNFVFSVSGYGHGVGMSQYGANYMAQQGSNYKEIISAYYRGTEIIDLP